MQADAVDLPHVLGRQASGLVVGFAGLVNGGGDVAFVAPDVGGDDGWLGLLFFTSEVILRLAFHPVGGSRFAKPCLQAQGDGGIYGVLAVDDAGQGNARDVELPCGFADGERKACDDGFDLFAGMVRHAAPYRFAWRL